MLTNFWRGWRAWLAWQEAPFVARDEVGVALVAEPALPVVAAEPDWMVPAYQRRQRASGDSIALARWQ